jgi:hypothetical protein
LLMKNTGLISRQPNLAILIYQEVRLIRKQS